MQPTLWKVRVLCGLTLLTLCGCFPHYPYGPYGAGGYPGVYNTPPGVPQGATILPPSTLTQPGGAPPTYESQSQQWRQTQDPVPPQSDAPAFDPNGNGPGEPSGSTTVPEYNDPGAFNADPDNLDLKEKEGETPFGYFDGTPAEAEDAANGVTSRTSGDQSQRFQTPVLLRPASSTLVSAETANTAGSLRPNPFDHDRKSYLWLRGVVDYDETDRTWNIIYNMNPDSKDRYGGSITLVDDGRLNVLRNEDVVLVEGRIDDNLRDRFGKPQYRVATLARLLPKNQ